MMENDKGAKKTRDYMFPFCLLLSISLTASITRWRIDGLIDGVLPVKPQYQ